MAVVKLSEKQKDALQQLRDVGPGGSKDLGVHSEFLRRLEDAGFIKECAREKRAEGVGRKMIVFKLTDKGRKRTR